MVGPDDRRPGDDEDVPAGLERGRHHPERLAESAADPVPNDRTSQGGVRSRSRSASSRGRSAGTGRRAEGGTWSFPPPGSPRSPAVERASRVAATMCRDRWSGRQPLPTPSSPCGQDAASRGRLHAGAEAVLLGAMALLGLVRLLHPGGAAILSIRPRGRSLRLPLEARKRAGAPRDTWRVVVRRMIGPRPEGVSNGSTGPTAPPRWRARRCEVRAPESHRTVVASRRPEAIGGSARIPLGSMRESPCDAVLAGAILCGPSAPETFAGDASRPRGGARQRSSGLVGWDVDRTVHRPRTPRPGTLAAASSIPVNPERRSYRTNGRQAGLASRPG